MGYIKELLPKIARYKAARSGLTHPGRPINFTFSVTNICQSRCKTCNIWKIYKDNPEKKNEELTLPEIEQIFRSLGHVYVFNVSGGEPFLRDDFAEIIKLACQHLTPGVIHIPTNAIAGKRIIKQLNEIQIFIKEHYPNVHLTVKPSLDHIGKKHDVIRGVPGNFSKVIALFEHLKALKPQFPQLHAELGTVISSWNVEDVQEISSFVSTLEPDSYRNEIAEQRSEMLNMSDPITPEPHAYEQAIQFFVSSIRSDMRQKVLFQRITNAFRLAYYDLAIKIMQKKTQILPCYAGISNAHMTPCGDIWACCTLGYDNPMGNLRDFKYDFGQLWNSEQAQKVRSDIKSKKCHCPLANQAYSNILMDSWALKDVLLNLFYGK